MKIFVYGTLKQGFYNHYYLKDETFLGPDVTAAAHYDMFEYKSDEAGYNSYPAIFENGSFYITGEVYEVSPATLARIDALEDLDVLYIRRHIKLANFGEVQTYISLGQETPMEKFVNIVNNNGELTFTHQDQTWRLQPFKMPKTQF